MVYRKQNIAHDLAADYNYELLQFNSITVGYEVTEKNQYFTDLINLQQLFFEIWAIDMEGLLRTTTALRKYLLQVYYRDCLERKYSSNWTYC